MEKKRSCKMQVRQLLAKYPELRNDDRALILHYWYFFDRFPVFLPAASATRLTAPMNICRARGEIQKSGEFPPTDEQVAQKRKRMSMWRTGEYSNNESEFDESVEQDN